MVLDGDASIRSQVNTFAPGNAVDFGMTVLTPLPNAGLWFCGGFQRQNDFTNVQPWILWISRAPSNIQTEIDNGLGVVWTGSNVPVNQGVGHVYGVDRFQKKVVFRYDHVEKANHGWGAAYGDALQIRFSAYAGSKIRVTFARVRQARDPWPEASLGKSEQYP